MRVRAVTVAVACIGVLGASGCGNSVHSCGVGDYKPTGQRGFASPRDVLRSVLAAYPSLFQDGWTASRGTRATEFRSGEDSIDVVRRSDGQWVTGAVTVCQ
jgi:hypothetical protein